eukprot:CAMPEP_0185768694 /NCGR_PEP_ID=MMETSP1174-20130828/51514_1 /TAXON_ID=35687 /ORGANISM="Dictyocha speculum, Strain CCMP1381" /LENGTH=64 /DNA_ID=CAMNT_0028453505 /DNA_START=71 /DNA_END=262 /DNA_ORIENTATION=-
MAVMKSPFLRRLKTSPYGFPGSANTFKFANIPDLYSNPITRNSLPTSGESSAPSVNEEAGKTTL